MRSISVFKVNGVSYKKSVFLNCEPITTLEDRKESLMNKYRGAIIESTRITINTINHQLLILGFME